MPAKLAGLALGLGISLATQAQTFNFTPITDPGNSLLQSLGNQLTIGVSQGASGDVLFTFTNGGSIDSTIAQVYFDDAPSSLFSNVSIVSGSNGVSFTPDVGPGNLPGGNAPTYAFAATEEFGATPPPPTSGINDSSAQAGESLTLSATLNAGKSFADVLSSLSGSSATSTSTLRVGLHVISIALFDNDGSASFISTGTGTGGNGGGASPPPPPIPEPETYGMLLAGLGLMAAMARRRKTGI